MLSTWERRPPFSQTTTSHGRPPAAFPSSCPFWAFVLSCRFWTWKSVPRKSCRNQLAKSNMNSSDLLISLSAALQSHPSLQKFSLEPGNFMQGWYGQKEPCWRHPKVGSTHVNTMAHWRTMFPHTHAHIYVHIYIYTYVCVCVLIYVYIYIQLYIHIVM